MTEAIRIIKKEHRAVAAVVHCLEHVVKDIKAGKLAPDFELLRAIIEYIEDFPDRFHHPKEDDYLFAALADRSPDARRLIRDLKDQHKTGERKVLDARWKLEDWENDAGDEKKAALFIAAALDYVEFQRSHMKVEETMIIPKALEMLTDKDWERINAAFSRNDDPIFGDHPRNAYDRLFSKIVSLAPEPIGFAQRKPPAKKSEGQECSTAADVLDSRGYRQAVLNLHWI